MNGLAKIEQRHYNHYKADVLNTCLQNPTTSSILIIPVKRLQNTKEVNASSQDNEHVEYLMRAAPNVKASGIELLREPRAIDQGADEGHSTLDIVVREARLFVELLGRE